MRALASVLLIPLALAGCARRERRAALPRANAIWLWHDPVSLPDADAEPVRRLGVSEVYALAGPFSNDGERLVLRLRRRFEPLDPKIPIRTLHLVYRFDGGGVHRALDDDPASAAGRIARAYSEDAARAKEQGWRVAGVQLDLDCPTRRLPRYGEMLARLRGGIGRKSLSITGLGTWLGGDVSAALRSVDFWCPQLYEFETPRELSGLTPLSSAGRIEALRPKLEALGVPYRVGIAAHGQALVYRNGRIEGTSPGISPSQAARAYPPEPTIAPIEGEERAGYRVGPDRVLLFRRPDPGRVRDALAAERNAGGLDAGFALFRLREPGEELVPGPALLTEAPPPPDPEFVVARRADPFAAIEGGSARIASDLTLDLVSRGGVPLPMRSDAVELELRFAPGSIESIAPGDFPGLRLVDADGRGPVSLARASGAYAVAPGIGDGLRLGPIVKKWGKLRVVARVRGYGPDGRNVERTVQKEL